MQLFVFTPRSRNVIQTLQCYCVPLWYSGPGSVSMHSAYTETMCYSGYTETMCYSAYTETMCYSIVHTLRRCVTT